MPLLARLVVLGPRVPRRPERPEPMPPAPAALTPGLARRPEWSPLAARPRALRGAGPRRRRRVPQRRARQRCPTVSGPGPPQPPSPAPRPRVPAPSRWVRPLAQRLAPAQRVPVPRRGPQRQPAPPIPHVRCASHRQDRRHPAYPLGADDAEPPPMPLAAVLARQLPERHRSDDDVPARQRGRAAPFRRAHAFPAPIGRECGRPDPQSAATNGCEPEHPSGAVAR